MSFRLCFARAFAKRYNIYSSALFGTSSSQWVKRFLTPNEEKELYLDITGSFREKLAEKKQQNDKMYSKIFDQVLSITFKKPLSENESTQLKNDLDKAAKRGDSFALDQLRHIMNGARLGTPMYNRLIRSYIMSGNIEKAEDVLASIEDQSLSRTTRSFTYLVSAYIEAGQLDKARKHIETMQHLSLISPRYLYDYEVLLKYYTACDDAFAVGQLWQQVQQYADKIKPGVGIYSIYMHWLLQKSDIQSLTKTVATLTQLGQTPTLTNYEQIKTLTMAAQALADAEEYYAADSLLIYFAHILPSSSKGKLPKEAIERIIMGYVANEQDLKALTFFYRLKKTGVPYTTGSSDIASTMQRMLARVETHQDLDHYLDLTQLERLK